MAWFGLVWFQGQETEPGQLLSDNTILNILRKKNPLFRSQITNGLKLTEFLISISKMIHVIGHFMTLCVLSSDEMVQKKHIPDPSPRLLKVELDGSPTNHDSSYGCLCTNGNANHIAIFATTLWFTYINSTPFLF